MVFFQRDFDNFDASRFIRPPLPLPPHIPYRIGRQYLLPTDFVGYVWRVFPTMVTAYTKILKIPGEPLPELFLRLLSRDFCRTYFRPMNETQVPPIRSSCVNIFLFWEPA
jgi:hypothetical protein